MHTVINRKEHGEFVTFYRMERVIDGHTLGVHVAVTRSEVRAGRDGVARRLRRARRQLQYAIRLHQYEQTGIVAMQMRYDGMADRPDAIRLLIARSKAITMSARSLIDTMEQAGISRSSPVGVAHVRVIDGNPHNLAQVIPADGIDLAAVVAALKADDDPDAALLIRQPPAPH